MQLPKVYVPGNHEDKIYALWEKNGAFKPVNRGGEDNYSIVLPPPNANGDLHVGHSLMFALQDAEVRYHRMKGDKTLWVPGTDHAGFETQVVYEKQLAKQGKSRFDLKREDLYQQIWDFVAKNRSNYEGQFRRLGASVDWEHYTYTLDEKIIKQAYETFKKMWDEKLIYRGERLVNYCTQHRTGFADIEVEYEDSETPLYYMKYGPFTLATTRPETKFGDTAVAVHPDDKRYSEYVGKVVTVEGVNGPFEVQVITDDFVDPNFGTGVVKITPAHSFDDWEVAQRHNLPLKRVIDHDGTLNELTGPYRGMTVMDARKAVVEALDKKGLLVKTDKHYKNRVGKCYKCGTVIEPMLMEQWFIDMKPLAEPAIKALKNKEITFYPDSKRTQLITYLKGLRDWNISRQIAWGIPIPAFQNVDDSDDWIFDTRVDQEIIEVNGKTYHRDPDMFDTWFSSSSWPYATLGKGSKDYGDFYPNSLMETGGEILYPWVSRMIMLGLYETGKIPFENVYIHGYVLAEDGAKMSKSVGNVIDPMAIVDKYGSDALRMGLINGRAPAINRGFDHRKVEDGRNFANKLWNVARFVQEKIGDDYADKNNVRAETVADEWILSRLNNAVKTVTKNLESYRFAEAYEHVYRLVWDDFADWYLEASKVELNKGVLAHGLETILKLAHPFAPFVTEAIWQSLMWEKDTLLITSKWPEATENEPNKAKDFEQLKTLINDIRNLNATAGLVRPTVRFTANTLLSKNSELVKKLAKLSDLTEVETGQGVKIPSANFNAWLQVDTATRQKIAEQLANKLKAEQGSIKNLEARLGNKSYVANAPNKLVEETKQQLELANIKVADIKAELALFN